MPEPEAFPGLLSVEQRAALLGAWVRRAEAAVAQHKGVDWLATVDGDPECPVAELVPVLAQHPDDWVRYAAAVYAHTPPTIALWAACSRPAVATQLVSNLGRGHALVPEIVRRVPQTLLHALLRDDREHLLPLALPVLDTLFATAADDDARVQALGLAGVVAERHAQLRQAIAHRVAPTLCEAPGARVDPVIWTWAHRLAETALVDDATSVRVALRATEQRPASALTRLMDQLAARGVWARLSRDDLAPLLQHPHREVRAHLLALLSARGERAAVPPALDDPSASTRPGPASRRR